LAPDRKNEILSAAGKCFAKFGYDKTTMDNIGEMVGMNKVSLYYYFKNKETLFSEMLLKEADDFGKMILKNIEGVTGCRNKIIAWIEEGFKYNQSGSVLHQLSMETLRKLTPQLEELKNISGKNMTKTIAAMLKEGQENHEIISCDADKIAETIQKIMYSMKNSAYDQVKTGLIESINFDNLVKDIVYAVLLILDGISVRK
jgi:AcrR family transcriptional regulator